MRARAKVAILLLTVLMVAVVALFARLALWQYDRAQQRAGVLKAYAVARRETAKPLPPSGVDDLPLYAHVYVRGRYESGRQILLIERPQPNGAGVGANVMTPLRMAGGGLLLVNRGWIPAGPRGDTRASLAPPAGTVRVSGFLAGLSRAGLRLGRARGVPGQWPRRLLYPRWRDLERLYGPGLVHRILWLGPQEPGGYDRAWRFRPAHGPDENYGYMAQWIGLAVTVFIVWLVLTLRALPRFHGDTKR